MTTEEMLAIDEELIRLGVVRPYQDNGFRSAPTTDPAAAMEVFEKCGEIKEVAFTKYNGRWLVWIRGKEHLEKPTAKTLPLALAKFARQLFNKKDTKTIRDVLEGFNGSIHQTVSDRSHALMRIKELAKERDTAIEQLRVCREAASTLSKRIKEVSMSCLFASVFAQYANHGGQWPSDLNWSKELIALDKAIAVSEGGGER